MAGGQPKSNVTETIIFRREPVVNMHGLAAPVPSIVPLSGTGHITMVSTFTSSADRLVMAPNAQTPLCGCRTAETRPDLWHGSEVAQRAPGQRAVTAYLRVMISVNAAALFSYICTWGKRELPRYALALQ